MVRERSKVRIFLWAPGNPGILGCWPYRPRANPHYIPTFSLANTRIANRPNAGGANDGKVYVVQVSREGSFPLYIIVGACHPSLIRSGSISADYPGSLRDSMSKVVGADVEIIFLQGFSGNLRARLLASEPFKLWPPAALSRFVFDRHTFRKDTSADDTVSITLRRDSVVGQRAHHYKRKFKKLLTVDT